MFNRILKGTRTIVFSFLLSALVVSCKDDNNTPEPGPEPSAEKEFMVWVMAGNPVGSYILPTETLTGGKLSPVGNGIDMTALGTSAPMGVLDKDGYLYYILNNKFNKARIENNQLVPVGSIVQTSITYIGAGFFNVWDGNKLVMFEDGKTPNSRPVFSIVDTEKMEVVASGTLDIPVWETDEVTGPDGKTVPVSMRLRAVTIKDGKLFVSWNYNKETGDLQYHSGFLDYPSMQNFQSEFKTDYLIESNGVVFTDDQGHTYLRKVDDAYNHGYVRIKKGETSVDPTYNFDLKLQNTNIMGDVWDLGNNKQLLLYYEKIASWEVGFVVIDIKSGKMIGNINDLGLPFGSQQGGKFVLIDDGKAYIGLTSDEGSFIWEYDHVANKLNRGLEIEGGVSSIPYVTRLK